MIPSTSAPRAALPHWWTKLNRRLPFTNLGLGPRLIGAFLLVAALALTAAAIGLLGLGQALEAGRLLDRGANTIEDVQALRLAFIALPAPLSDFLLAHDLAASARFEAAVAAARDRSARLAAAQPAPGMEPGLLAATAADLDRIERLGESVLASPTAGSGDLAEIEQLADGAAARWQPVLDGAQADLVSARARYATAQRGATAGLLASALLAVALALGLAWYSTRRLTVSLAGLAAATERIAGGDLATNAPAGAPGELGHLTGAFERMRLGLAKEHDRARRLAILEERDRIGREMHDGLAQVLGYVNTKAQAAREFLKAGQGDAAALQLGELIEAAREGYTDAREAITDLRAERVNERPLAELLVEHVGRFARQSGLAAEVRVAPNWPEAALPPIARVQLLRIVQEALTNIRKHAEARHAWVSLGAEGEQALVRIADDGRGFALSLLLSPEFARYGLRTMRERAQAVGGTFRIESLPGGGTRILVHVPLAEREETTAP